MDKRRIAASLGPFRLSSLLSQLAVTVFVLLPAAARARVVAADLRQIVG
jgi:hypothetical protein